MSRRAFPLLIWRLERRVNILTDLVQKREVSYQIDNYHKGQNMVMMKYATGFKSADWCSYLGGPEMVRKEIERKSKRERSLSNVKVLWILILPLGGNEVTEGMSVGKRDIRYLLNIRGGRGKRNFTAQNYQI